MLDTANNTKLVSIQIHNSIEIIIKFDVNYPQFIKKGGFEFVNITIDSDVPEQFLQRCRLIRLQKITFTDPSYQINLNPSISYPLMQDLNIMYPEHQTRYTSFTISDFTLPALYPTNPVFISSYNPIDLYFNHTTLQRVYYERVDHWATPKGNFYFINAPALDYLDIFGSNIIPSDLRTIVPKLENFIVSNINDVQLVPLLELDQSDSKLSTYPPLNTFKDNSQTYETIIWDASNNNFTGPLPEFNITRLTFSNNPFFAGPIPDSYCRAATVSFTGTALTNKSRIPDCFFCAWSDMQSSFPPMQIDLSTFICNTTLDTTKYVKLPTENSITIRGKNLGYGQDIQTPGLTLLLPNERFKYNVASPSGSQSLVFSQKYSISRSVSWVTDATVITKASVDKFYDQWLIKILGTFDVTLTYNLKYNGVTTSLTVSASMLSANVSTTTTAFPNTNNRITISNINQDIDYNMVNYQYPSISSFTPTKVSSTSISFFGFFVPDEIPDDCGTQSLCNGNGNCVAGQCQCLNGFGGHYCESTLTPGSVDVISNTSSPSTTIKAGNETFMFAIVGVQELNNFGEVVYVVSTQDNVSFNTITSTGVTSYVYNITSPTPDQSDLSVALQIDVFSSSRTIEFAGQTVVYPANSVKVTVTIDQWTFKSNLNSLRVLLHKDGSLINDTSRCGTKNVVSIDQLDNVQYLKVINSNGVELFGRFLHYALSDGRPAISRNEIINTSDTSTLIGINLPHCLQRCIVDPDFSVLFDQANVLDPNSDCNDNSKDGDGTKVSWKLIVITVVPIVGGIIFITLIAVLIIHKLHGRRLGDVVSHKLHKMSNKGKSY
ncbi:hypothetical protein SAMD00019534_055700 [Acytostelium subglobosum LB1]|uniref:hypothetical protein n=1 Tax=Acytostelium subglobosum LB1 TaxID=1410327 RepID=UPI0006449795|nr:hypothetical protein SAMD00019534_055700 [Acytostelium subglobosum LB1]GAM22395.1 hypothetical protein SAMD00019534_055700 [Acytostelium subglobosum LB1]|eukprot:XP_012754515.1 hypothetical protein SAMD00019534_055700 [Acytostelium subglobosum LB1]